MNRCPHRPFPLLLWLALASCALAGAPRTGHAVPAGIPDPSFCTADSCLVISPGGERPYVVILRDESYAPIAGATVVLDFAPAPGIVLCAVSDSDGDRRVTAVTDGSGRAELHVRGGGQSSGYVVVGAVAQTVRLAYPRSTDLNGDLAVSQTDVTLHAGLPALARAGDYDCDGDSDALDRAQVTGEIGRDCQSVPVVSSTWGRVKACYR